MSAADGRERDARSAPRDASRLSEDALDVARFCWPDPSWKESWHKGVILHLGDGRPNWFDFEDANDIAAAERVLVERGLGQWYGLALAYELGWSGRYWSPALAANECASFEATGNMLAALRTAPLEVCLRAMARVVREKQPKEKA